MTTDPSDRIRVTRRRRKHERQAVVFGVLIAFLAVSGLGALAIYSGAIALPNQPEFVVNEPTGATIAQKPVCLPEETTPLPYGKVHITVLNGSDRGGLAGTVAKMLGDRGFAVDGTGNDPRSPATGLIQFGAKGITQAYTLLAHYPDAQLVLDGRTSTKIDLTVPESFEDLAPTESINLDLEAPLSSLPGCAPADEVTPLPIPTRLEDEEKKAAEAKEKKAAKKAKADKKKAEASADGS